MTLTEKYAGTAAIGHYGMSNFGGLEVLDIEYGINDKLITCFNWGTGRQMIRKNMIYSTPGGRQYIRKNGVRYYLDEILRACTIML